MQAGYIVVGLGLGLLGWLLYRAGLPLIGGIVGAIFGGAIAYLLAGAFHLQNSSSLAVLGVVFGIVLGILLIRALLTYFFFATGAALGAAIALHLTGTTSQVAGVPQGVLVSFCSLAGGLLLVYLRRFVVALISAVAGAVVFSMGLPREYQGVGMLVALVVFVAAQIGLVRRFVDQEAFDARTRNTLREE